MRRITHWLAAALCLSGLACKASVNAEANANLSGNAEAEAESEAEPTASGAPETAAFAGEAPPVAANPNAALLGARHDVRLASVQNPPRCSCLAVAVGGANDPAFQWRGAAPELDPASQLVVALGSEGVPCQAAPEGSLGASYWGYRQNGADVQVVVETARAGRPLTHGAIIPKPTGDGRVVVVPLDEKVPYGRGSDGGPCRVDGR